MTLATLPSGKSFHTHTWPANLPCQHCLAKHDTGFLESVIGETRAQLYPCTFTLTHMQWPFLPLLNLVAVAPLRQTHSRRLLLNGISWHHRKGEGGGLNNRHVITLLAFQMTSPITNAFAVITFVLQWFKGIVHAKMKILMSFTCLHVIPNPYAFG